MSDIQFRTERPTAREIFDLAKSAEQLLTLVLALHENDTVQRATDLFYATERFFLDVNNALVEGDNEDNEDNEDFDFYCPP